MTLADLLLEYQALNGTVLAKDFLELGISPGSREVLSIDVIEGLSEFSSVLGGIGEEFKRLELVLAVENLQSNLLGLEVDEPVAS